MFENDRRSQYATLKQMHNEALQRCRANQVEARDKLAEYISRDGRFQHLDAHKLAARYEECWSSGAQMDFESPELKRGGQPSPRGWRNPSTAG